MENIKETVINESTVFSTENEDKIIYRIVAVTNKGRHSFSIAAESMVRRHTETSRIDGFSDSLSESADFIRYLIENKTPPNCLFEEALKFMTQKLQNYIKQKDTFAN